MDYTPHTFDSDAHTSTNSKVTISPIKSPKRIKCSSKVTKHSATSKVTSCSEVTSKVNIENIAENESINTSLMLINKNVYNQLINNIITEMSSDSNIKISPEELSELNLDRLTWTISVPTKIESTIRNHVSSSLKNAIHKDIDVVVDMCMILCSMITLYGEDNPYTIISSSRFVELFGMRTYPKIIKLLTRGTKTKSPFIECDYDYTPELKSYGYRFTEDYRNKGKINYKVKTVEGRDIILILLKKKLLKAMSNPISNEIIKSYSHIELPTEEEIIAEGKRLEGSRLKNGKILKFLNGQSSKLYVSDKYSFVEEDIKLFKVLTEDGLYIPTVHNGNAGGRVTDSFTLMPWWIRNICKINGLEFKYCELDYKSFHPNIAYKLYDKHNETEFLRGDAHRNVAKLSGIPLLDVKKIHLSFFNQQIWQMEESKLHYFYETYCPEFLNTIKEIKRKTTYKQISKELFTFEVDVMTEVINRLPEGGHVIYVYDCLYSDNPIVGQIMNDVAKDFGLETFVEF